MIEFAFLSNSHYLCMLKLAHLYLKNAPNFTSIKLVWHNQFSIFCQGNQQFALVFANKIGAKFSVNALRTVGDAGPYSKGSSPTSIKNGTLWGNVIKLTVSLRTSDGVTGVAIRNILLENGFPRQCEHWLGMTIYLTK